MYAFLGFFLIQLIIPPDLISAFSASVNALFNALVSSFSTSRGPNFSNASSSLFKGPAAWNISRLTPICPFGSRVLASSSTNSFTLFGSRP